MHCIRLLAPIILTTALLGKISLQSVAADSSLTAQVREEPLFTTPIEWVGTKEPTERDSVALLEAMRAFRGAATKAGYEALEAFIAEHPESPWTPSLQTHLAERYRTMGRYTPALKHWEGAWAKSEKGTDRRSREVAARALAGWMRLLGSVGQKARLEELLEEADKRDLFATQYAPLLRSSREGLSVMKGRPGESYRCGSLALSRVMNLMGSSTNAFRAVMNTPSPDGGFRMSELLTLAKTNQFNVAPVYRAQGTEIPVPCVIHWKLDHYAAVVEERDGRYKVIDPTFDGLAWMDATTINEEASGFFLVPGDLVPPDWRRLSNAEAEAVRGKGYTYTADDESDHSGDDEENDECDPPDANDGPEGGGEPCPPEFGMPVWRVSDPHMTLWIHDVPLFYRDSRGGWVRLRLSYKHRSVPRTAKIGGFGAGWECNWIGFVEQDSAQPDSIKNYLAGGGSVPFETNGTAEYWSARRLTVHSTGAPIRIESAGSSYSGTPTAATSSGGGTGGGARAPIGGSENRYGDPLVYGVGVTNYLLTNRIDRYGRATHYSYTNTPGSLMKRLISMKDKDGRISTLAYTNDYYGLITSVTDPYGRTARFFYDLYGRLTNIVDMAGLSSYFQYDDSGAITNMITPYGTNSFRYFYHAGDPGYWSRGLEITEPTGDKQLCVYHEAVAGNVMNHHMHSYHWNRQQYAALSSGGKADPLEGMTESDFDLAPRTEWLRTDLIASNARLIASPWKTEGPKDPLLGQRSDYVEFTYPGQSYNVPQTFNRVVRTDWGTGDKMETPRNAWGRPTEFKYFRNGQWVSFTNVYNADGRRLEQVWGPNGERVRQYEYDATRTNLLVTVKNHLDDAIWYTHDASARVGRINYPNGLVTSNIYYTTGPSAGFLKTRIDVGIRTNHYTWSGGNLEWHTNELGLATKQTWDNLNRLTSVSFPDGTTVSNVYSKLDRVAVKDRLNNWTYFGFNRLRQLVARTNANGRITEWDWCDCGSPAEVTDWNGSSPVVTQFAYDIAGRLTNVVFADGYSRAYRYDVASRVSHVSDSAQTTLQIAYADYGQIASASLSGPSASGGAILSRTYDEYGRIATETDRNSVTTFFGYDIIGRMAFRKMINGVIPSTHTFTWTPWGLQSHVDELGRTNRFSHDERGRLIYHINAQDQLLSLVYNPADQLVTLTDHKSQVTRWNYDREGRVTNKVDAAGSEILRYKYDAEGRLTNRWTAAKGDTFYSHDAIGNLTTVNYPGTIMDVALHYDKLDRLTNVVDGIGTTLFTYTAAGQVLSEDGPWNQDTVSYGYTHRRRSLLTVLQQSASPWTQNYSYDGLARLTSATSAAGSFAYAYLNGISDRVQTLTLPGTGNSIGHQYDALARLTETELNTAFASPANHHSYTLDAGHQRTRQTFTDNNYVDYSYDKIGQLKTAKGWEAGGGTARAHEQFGYGYDNAWNLRYRTNNSLVQVFNTDNRNQLSTATRSGTLTVAGQASVPGASINNVTVSGTGLSSGAATVYADGSWARPGATLADGNNSYTATATDNTSPNPRTANDSVSVNLPATVTFQYDANGNLTNDGRRFFEYDYENQLTSVSVAGAWRSEFKYDAFGRRRVRKEFTWSGSAWLLTSEVRYVYDGMLVVQERNTSNITLVSYTRGNDLSGSLQGAGGIGGLLARSDLSHPQGPNAYYHVDGSGNVTALVNSNGFVVARYHYDPYGNLLGMGGPLAEANTYLFSSKEWHANAGLYYYGFRYYEPNLQRWVNQDPIEEAGGINLYGFVVNDPMTTIDPSGLGFFKKAFKICKAIKDQRALEAVDTVKETTGRRTVDGVKKALDDIDKTRTPRVVEAPDKPSSNALAAKLSEDGRPAARGRETSPGYPEHINPNKGKYSDVHIQTPEATKKAGWKYLTATILIPHANRVSNNPDSSWFDLGLAGLWDLASTVDPIFLTDGLEWIFDVQPEDFPECQ